MTNTLRNHARPITFAFVPLAVCLLMLNYWFYKASTASAVASLAIESSTAPGDETTTGTATAVAMSSSWISVTSPFVGDYNRDGYTTFEIGTSGNGPFSSIQYLPGTQQWRATTFSAGPNLTYFIKVTYFDPDGVVGPNPQVVGPIKMPAAAAATTIVTVETATAVVGDGEIYVSIPIRDDANQNSQATVEVATNPSGPWTRKAGPSMPLNPKRARLRSLTPDTDYWVRIAVTDSDGVNGKSTQTLGPIRYAGLQNLALGKVVTADLGYSSCCTTPAQLVDGRIQYDNDQYGFSWRGCNASGGYGIKQATIDLGAPTIFNRAVVWYHDQGRVPKVWSIQYSDDNVTWAEAYFNNTPRCRTDSVAMPGEWSNPACGHDALFAPVSARYVRYSFDDRTMFGCAAGWAVEIEVFNDDQPRARKVRVRDASVAPNRSVAIPIELAAQGDENALSFSLMFDPGVLSNPQIALGSDAVGASLIANAGQAASGRVGVTVVLPATQRFAAGARQIAVVTLTAAANAPLTTTQVGFSDQPIGREVVDVSATILNTTYLPGTVTISLGYEADVSPRPNGSNDGTVTITDLVQVGRFVAGVDALAAGSEYQRADCAPVSTLGDGRISIADWVQAGRYAAGLNAVVSAGGPTAPVSSFRAIGNEELAERVPTARAVRLVGGNIDPGQSSTLTLELDAQGDENALGFSLQFDPTQVSFVEAALGDGAGGATLSVNTAEAAEGRVGIAMALPTDQRFAAGTQQLLIVTFAAAEGATGATTVAIGDQPVQREIVDAEANSLIAAYSFGEVSMSRLSVSRYDAAPIDLGAVSERVYWILCGTDWRFRSALSAMTAKIGGRVVFN